MPGDFVFAINENKEPRRFYTVELIRPLKFERVLSVWNFNKREREGEIGELDRAR